MPGLDRGRRLRLPLIQSLKSSASCQPPANRAGRIRLALNTAFIARVASSCRRERGSLTMSLLKDIAAAASVLLVLLVVSATCSGNGEDAFSLDAALFDSALYAPRAGQGAEAGFARGATPADRIDAMFARFRPGEARPAKRYASAAAVIR
jgi:hypothetical protein